MTAFANNFARLKSTFHRSGLRGSMCCAACFLKAGQIALIPHGVKASTAQQRDREHLMGRNLLWRLAPLIILLGAGIAAWALGLGDQLLAKD